MHVNFDRKYGAILLASLYRVDFFSLFARGSEVGINGRYRLRTPSGLSPWGACRRYLEGLGFAAVVFPCCMCTFFIPPFAFEVGKVVPCLYLLEDGWGNDRGYQPVSQSKFFLLLTAVQ